MDLLLELLLELLLVLLLLLLPYKFHHVHVGWHEAHPLYLRNIYVQQQKQQQQQQLQQQIHGFTDPYFILTYFSC